MKKLDCFALSHHFYDRVKVIQCSYKAGTVLVWSKVDKDSEIEITKLKEVEFKDILMHMLLHINEDFDDDLLYDCVRLLSEE